MSLFKGEGKAPSTEILTIARASISLESLERTPVRGKDEGVAPPRACLAFKIHSKGSKDAT